MRCSDSISSPRTGVEAILTELGPGNQNRRYAASSHKLHELGDGRKLEMMHWRSVNAKTLRTVDR